MVYTGIKCKMAPHIHRVLFRTPLPFRIMTKQDSAMAEPLSHLFGFSTILKIAF